MSLWMRLQKVVKPGITDLNLTLIVLWMHQGKLVIIVVTKTGMLDLKNVNVKEHHFSVFLHCVQIVVFVQNDIFPMVQAIV